MRVPITKELNLEDFKSKIEAKFPGINVQWRGKKMLVINEPGTSAAAFVMARKDKAIVNDAFATMGSQMIFSLSLVLFGILIRFIIYMITFQPKQKAIRMKVADFIKEEWGQVEVK